jgi:hypothetical protein
VAVTALCAGGAVPAALFHSAYSLCYGRTDPGTHGLGWEYPFLPLR